MEKLLDVLPNGSWIGWVFEVPYMCALIDRFYRWFARNRYRLGCGSQCTYRELSVELVDEEADAVK